MVSINQTILCKILEVKKRESYYERMIITQELSFGAFQIILRVKKLNKM